MHLMIKVRVKRLFWAVILLSCCFGAGSVLRSALRLFSTGVASYSLETNYLAFDTPFPAVTVCDASNELNRTLEYLKEHKKSSVLTQFYRDVAYWTVRYCKTCDACKNINIDCEENFYHGVNEIRYKCPDLLTDCWWGGKYSRCCDIFHPVKTEFGECYVFNSALLGNKSIHTVNKVIGLPNLLFSAVKTVDVTVHAPDDMVSARFENILGSASSIPLVTDFEAILKVEQTVNDASVLSLPVSMRGCLFKNEQPSIQGWPFQQYTYSACLLHCRRLAQITSCNCTHHFISDIFGTPACDIKGLICLSHKKGVILNYPCDCPTACDDTQFKTVHIFLKLPGRHKAAFTPLQVSCDQIAGDDEAWVPRPDTLCAAPVPEGAKTGYQGYAWTCCGHRWSGWSVLRRLPSQHHRTGLPLLYPPKLMYLQKILIIPTIIGMMITQSN